MKSKVTAGILGILLGAFGAHKFYLGYTSEAITMLLVTLIAIPVLSLITLGLAAPLGGVMGIIGLVEGIMYLTKSDEEFEDIYVNGHKGWF